jgi:hypothetical protein
MSRQKPGIKCLRALNWKQNFHAQEIKDAVELLKVNLRLVDGKVRPRFVVVHT